MQWEDLKLKVEQPKKKKKNLSGRSVPNIKQVTQAFESSDTLRAAIARNQT